jgi:hypothetical protein
MFLRLFSDKTRLSMTSPRIVSEPSIGPLHPASTFPSPWQLASPPTCGSLSPWRPKDHPPCKAQRSDEVLSSTRPITTLRSVASRRRKLPPSADSSPRSTGAVPRRNPPRKFPRRRILPRRAIIVRVTRDTETHLGKTRLGKTHLGATRYTNLRILLMMPFSFSFLASLQLSDSLDSLRL